MSKSVLLSFGLASLLLGCSTASRQASRHFYGPPDVEAGEAQYARLMAESEQYLDRDTFVHLRTLWQQRLRAEAELQRLFAEQGIAMDSEYYKLKCQYLDAATVQLQMLIQMLKKNTQPNHAVEPTRALSGARGSP